MDEDHRLRLQSGVAAWNAWRVAHPGLRPALAQAPLRAMDLSGADLGQADLSGADLRGTRLVGADLHGADLRGANLFKAELAGEQILAAPSGQLLIQHLIFHSLCLFELGFHDHVTCRFIDDFVHFPWGMQVAEVEGARDTDTDQLPDDPQRRPALRHTATEQF